MSKVTSAKKKVAGLALAGIMAVTMIATTAAAGATITYNFTRSGNVYGITTTCKNFSGAVEANARVTTNTGYTHRWHLANRNAEASASRASTNGTFIQEGWAIW
jgi:hypothetical protein